MAVYRFRVTFEDNEEVYREIEIKSTQHFEDFHNAIVQAIGFDNLHTASFYISDEYWRKGDEITLRPLDEDDTELRKRKGLAPKRQMNKCKVATVIEDPHQKFVYVYDLKTGWTFLVELMKIVADDPKGSYPRCIKTVGEAPKQYKVNALVPPLEEDEEIDDEPHTDEDAYVHAVADDETALLESEEGEEEEVDAEAEDDAPGLEGGEEAEHEDF
jgi:hypothetical protein